MAKKKGLGAGLANLIPQAQHVPPQGVDVIVPPKENSAVSRDARVHDLLGPGENQRLRKKTTTKTGAAKNSKTNATGSAVEGETSGLSPTVQGGVPRIGRDELVPVPGASFSEIPIDQIVANSRQPREYFDEDELTELSASIAEVGVLQPIVVRPQMKTGPEGQKSNYELIMGERRLRAATLAGLSAIPAIVRQTADEDLLRDALLENLHRVALNPLEEAAAYQQLLDDFGCTQEELAKKIARSRPQIANTLRLLKLPGSVQTHVAAGTISAGHARALLSLDSKESMAALAQRIIAEGLSVRSTEEIIALGDADTAPSQAAGRRSNSGPSEAELHYAEEISGRLDTRVKVKLGRSKGRITIDFAGEEDLNRIIALINRN